MMMSRIEEYLDYLFPEPKCELNYKTDYELLIAIMLSAQSTDKRVNSVTPVIFEKYSTLKALKEAKLEDLEVIIRPVGSYRKKSLYTKEIARRLVDEFDGVVPTDREVLESFPGIGRKTVNVFLSEFYNYPAIAVDTHVERVSKRLGLINNKATPVDVEKKLEKMFEKDIHIKLHHQLIHFGRYHCLARNPQCANCKLVTFCKYFKKKK